MERLERNAEERTTQPHGRLSLEEEGRFEVTYPGRREKPVSEDALRLMSEGLRAVLAAETLDEERIQTLQGLAVAAGERVGRRPEPTGAGIQVEAGKHVAASAEGAYLANRYGYLCLQENRLAVAPPLWMDPEAMQVYWLLLDERPQSLTVDMVLQCLADLGVVEGIKEGVIEALVAQVTQGSHTCGASLIAEGTSPVAGEGVRVEILVDNQRVPGKERADGSIDFHEVNFAANVQEGQLIVRRIPPTPGIPGMDVKGGGVEAPDGQDQILKPGKNVEVRVENGAQHFHATVTGVLQENGDEIAVTRLLHISGDVDFKTGNLDFDGEICVKGSIIQGFSVKASSDITITGTVEVGAMVTAGRNLTVGRGVVGRKTRVSAGATVRAQFAQEATLAAGRDILLGNYAYQARLRAGRRVRIAKGEGKRGGSLVGGQTWAHTGVEVYLLGSASHAPTLLMVGVSPQHLQQLDRLKESVDLAYNQLRRLLEQFGLARVDVGQIKNLIAAAVGPRRKLLASKARQMGQVVQTHQKLLAARQQLERRMATQVANVEIEALEQTFPGVEIRLGEHKRTLQEEMVSPCFRIVDGQLVER